MHIIYIYTHYICIYIVSQGPKAHPVRRRQRHSAHSELVIPGWAKKQGSWQALTEAEKKTC